MTPKAAPRRILRADDEGISTVLGAVLLFGLLVVTLVLIQVRFVPVWDEDREAEQMAHLADQVAILKGDLDRLAGNASASALTDALLLQPEAGSRFFHRSVGTATATFEPSPAAAGLRVESPNLRMFTRGGRPLFGLGEEWVAITTGEEVDDVVRVDHLRMRIDLDPGAYDDGDSITLTVTDADGVFAGRAVVEFQDFPSEQALELRTYGPDGAQVSSDLEAFFQQTEVDWMFFDLLDPALLFGDVLAAADAPLHLSLTKDGLEGDYTIAYATGSGGFVGTGGLDVPDYDQVSASGRLQVEARNARFTPQTYVVEHGAVILEQPDGAVLLVAPQFAVAASDTLVALSWTVPGLTGASATVGGTRSAAAVLQPNAGGQDFTAAAARLTFTVPTQHPEVWRAYLASRLAAAGLSDTGAAPEFVLSSTADSVTLDLRGRQAGVADTTEDIAIRFLHTPIALELRPAG